MAMVDQLPDGLRELFNEFEQAHVLDAIALAGTKDPEPVRRLLERDRKLRQQDVLDGTDPAFVRKH
jgi:hypothetical protein